MVRVGRFWTDEAFKLPKQRLILEDIHAYFTDERLKATLMRFLTPEEGGSGDVSKRDMDWLVTNYCKKYNVSYKWQIHPDWPAKVITLYDEYHAWLRQYRRYLFDIFCRGQRVYFDLDGKTYETTVGQLNFLYWAERYGVLQYLQDNYAQIAADHRCRQAQARKEKKEAAGKKRKRHELTPMQQPVCQVFDKPIEFRWV